VPTVVLVPLDHSADAPSAIPVAAEVARLWGIGVLLMTVVVPNGNEVEAADHLRAVAARAGLTGFQVEVRASGATGESILRVAADRDAIICMATHSRGRLGELVLGSLSQLVVARSPEPVVLVGPSARPGEGAEAAPHRLGSRNHGPLVVPLDGSPSAERAVAAAAPWAQRFGVGLHLVHAVPKRGSANPVPDPADLVRRAGDRTGSAEVPVTAEVVPGDPVEVITTAVHAQGSPLIVLTSRGVTAEKNRTLSDVARRIVRASPVPVLVLPHHSARTGTGAN